MKNIWTALALFGACVGSAHSGEVYTGIGTHGVTLGYAQSISPLVTVRADFATFGNHRGTEVEEGITYDGTLKYSRAGVFADYFVSGGFRVTGGLTFNSVSLNLLARGEGTPIEIGGTQYILSPADRFNVRVEMPKVMPFIGIGYGHQPADRGFGFHFDVGASIGKAKLAATTSGPLFDSQTPQESAQLQADINAELAELRNGVGKIKAIPLISLGINYRF